MERIARYRELQAKNPQSRAYLPLADLLRQKGDYSEALGLLEEGLARNPGHQGAMVVLGSTLLQAGRTDHGVKVLERVLELSPDNFVVLKTLAECFLASDSFAEALPLLEKLVELEPDHGEWADLLLETSERLEGHQNAIKENNLDPETVDTDSSKNREFATMTLVDILVAQGYLDKALVALQRMQKNDPQREEVRNRILEIQGSLAQTGPQTETQESGQPDIAVDRKEVLKQRAAHKEQFGNWIDGLKSQENPFS